MNGVDGASLLDRIQDKPEPEISLKKILACVFSIDDTLLFSDSDKFHNKYIQSPLSLSDKMIRTWTSSVHWG